MVRGWAPAPMWTVNSHKCLNMKEISLVSTGAMMRGLSEPLSAGSTTRVAIDPTPAGLAEAARAFDGFVSAHGLPEPVRRRMLLALDEVLSNVVHHGGAPQGEPIHLTFALSADRLVVEVTDAARAFNPLDMPPPDTTAPLAARVPGGLGIALVRAMLSRVDYARRGHRNVLTLTLEVRSAVSGDVNGDS